MGRTIRIDLHCHSTFSDGSWPPERVAEAMAGAGVRVACLTDHDTIEGHDRFAQAARQRQVMTIPGAEITVEGVEGLHLLAYGFDPQNAELGAMLLAHRRHRADRQGDPVQAMRRLGEWAASWFKAPGEGTIAGALPDAAEVIRIVHRAGGLVFLAHPLTVSGDPAQLERSLEELKSAGLDGLEVVYAQYDPARREQLLELARRHGLLVSGGSDFHGVDRPGLSQMGIDFPEDLWRGFCAAAKLPWGDLDTADERPTVLARRGLSPTRHQHSWGRFIWRIILPTVLAMGISLSAIFGVIVPLFESSLMERKREMIRELTRSALSILANAQDQAPASDSQAVERAKARARQEVARLRYGKEGKDYFWIIDMHPRMIMHPYRPDLDGTDLSGFEDAHGRRLFTESAALARERGEGFVHYYWQWKDNPVRVVPKESFVKRFEPWNWIIGTGIYLDDVQAEIASLTHRLVAWCLAISGAVSLLMGWTALQSLRIERRRAAAESDLHESHEKYAALVEASNEGTLMVLEGRCAYVNRTLCNMLGYGEAQILLRPIADLLHADGIDNSQALAAIEALTRGGPEPAPFEARLPTRSSGPISAVITLSRVALAGKSGFIMVVRDVSRAHPAGRAADSRHDSLMEEMRMALLFLSEPLRVRAGKMPTCDAGASIRHAAELLSRDASDAVAVTAAGQVVGIVTDHDLRQRVLLADMDVSRPIGQVMSSPVLALPESAPVHEALAAMREHNVSHLGVLNDQGNIAALVRATDLLQFHQYATPVLAGAIEKAASPQAVAQTRAKLPRLVGALLECGARPRNILHITTRLGDAIVQRLLELAIKELGPPPGRLCFMALGSEGRGEQTLLTDQDNAIVYEDPGKGRAEVFEKYFLKLGERVCADLDQAGYALCRGQVMARSAKWCRSLSAWKTQAATWIGAAEPQDLFDFSVFFDFRPVAGDASLAAELRASIQSALRQDPPFFLHMSRHAMAYRIPVGFFGKIVTGAGDGHGLDLKEAMRPITTFARLYGLRHGIEATNTFDRLDRLEELQILRTAFRDEVAQAYTFLMQKRLERQSLALAEQKPCDNLIDPKTLTHMDVSMLKQSLGIISTIQKKISYDFLGVA